MQPGDTCANSATWRANEVANREAIVKYLLGRVGTLSPTVVFEKPGVRIMTRQCLTCLIVLCLFFAPRIASAQEIVLGLGTTDYRSGASDDAVFEFEYRHKTFRERRVFSAALGANASVSGEGDAFVGGGIWFRWEWPSGWFIDNSLMPGFHEEGTDVNDLGSTFVFRSLLGFGYRLNNDRAISAVITHKSNAGLASDNPGMNTYHLRYHMKF